MGGTVSLLSVAALAPQLLILILAVAVLFYDKALKPPEKRNMGLMTAWGSFLIILVTIGIWLFYEESGQEPVALWGGMIRYDQVTLVFTLMFLIALLVTALISLDVKGLQKGEYYALLMTATLGFIFMAASYDLIMLYLALETASISLYILADFNKGEYRSKEAGMKYFIYGAFASAVMLFGLSYIYGLTQETNIPAVAQQIANALASGLDPAVLVASALVVVGFGFKISAVPFHFWAPDVYEGAPTPVTGLVSTASKAAGFAIFLRILAAGVFGLPDPSSDWWAMLVAMCIVTMTLGNLLAIHQKNIKRMLAYSSIAQAGYAMIGLVTLTVEGSAATMFFLIYYLISNIAVFGIIILVSNLTGSDEVDDLRGLSRRSPILALAMMFALLSLAGIPPTAGFFGKFFLFRATIDFGLWWLAAIGIFNAFIALYYYLGIIKVMYLYRSDEEDVPFPVSRAAKLAIGLTLFGIFYLGIFADRAFQWTRAAAVDLYTFIG